MRDVILGLGSNMGERLNYLGAAVWKLSYLLQDMRVSQIVESQAVLPANAPPDYDRPFLNMAVCGASKLTPHQLLEEVKLIEMELGRKQRGVWAPREIDIDIIGIDDLVVAQEALIIPHKEALNRDFVMIPVAQVAPDWIYPVRGNYYGMRAEEIIAAKGYCFNAALRETDIAI